LRFDAVGDVFCEGKQIHGGVLSGEFRAEEKNLPLAFFVSLPASA
jgi:hypothetical protein